MFSCVRSNGQAEPAFGSIISSILLILFLSICPLKAPSPQAGLFNFRFILRPLYAARYKEFTPSYGSNSRLTSYIRANFISHCQSQIGGKLVLNIQRCKDYSLLEVCSLLAVIVASSHSKAENLLATQ